LSALKTCDVAAFEDAGFIAGYVRLMPRYLGMDPEWAYTAVAKRGEFYVAHGMSPIRAKRGPGPRTSAK